MGLALEFYPTWKLRTIDLDALAMLGRTLSPAAISHAASGAFHVFVIGWLAWAADPAEWQMAIQRGKPITLSGSMPTQEADVTPETELAQAEPEIEMTEPPPELKPTDPPLTKLESTRPADTTPELAELAAESPTPVAEPVRRDTNRELLQPHEQSPAFVRRTVRELPKPVMRPAEAPSRAVAFTQVTDAGADVDTPPRKLTENAAPDYPLQARLTGAEGRVLLIVTVNEEGRVIEARINRSSGHPLLDASAITAVRDWRFSPAQRAGQAVVAKLIVPIRFSLRRG